MRLYKELWKVYGYFSIGIKKGVKDLMAYISRRIVVVVLSVIFPDEEKTVCLSL
jgi:hypothetical protein